jgi:hypothetical protein
VTNVGIASVKQRKLPLVRRRMKLVLGIEEDAPVDLLSLFDQQADSISRTAVYLTRMPWWCGEGGRREAPLSRLGVGRRSTR